MDSESARMSSAAEARFRVDYPNSKPRVVKVVALDTPSERVVKRVAQRAWQRATFFTSIRFEGAPRGGESWSMQAWLGDHLDENLGVDALAARIGMSPRTFARVFRRETGTTPAVFVEGLRVEAARRLLETTDLTVAAVAARVGMKHAETLHRAFHRRLGTTPDRYRQHFGRRAS